jgi:hypothetical protein
VEWTAAIFSWLRWSSAFLSATRADTATGGEPNESIIFRN